MSILLETENKKIRITRRINKGADYFLFHNDALSHVVTVKTRLS